MVERAEFVGNLISYKKWDGEFHLLESDIGDPRLWDNPPDLVLPVYSTGVSAALANLSRKHQEG